MLLPRGVVTVWTDRERAMCSRRVHLRARLLERVAPSLRDRIERSIDQRRAQELRRERVDEARARRPLPAREERLQPLARAIEDGRHANVVGAHPRELAA